MSVLLSRRRALLLLGGALTLVSRPSWADSQVPLQLQVQLVAKLGAFDRNFAARAGSPARVLVLQKAGDAESERVATNVANGLKERREVGGVPAVVELDRFASAQALAERCRAQKLALVYLATGLAPDMAAVAKALAGVDVLTVGATAAHAERGAVVGFDLEEGSPKIVANLAQAKAQNVAFRSELLKLARIVG